MINEVKTFVLKPAPRSTVIICSALLLIPISDFFILRNAAPKMIGLNIALNILIFALIAGLIWSIRHTRFEISGSGLRIRGDMWGKSFSWNELDVANARLVKFDAEPGLKPKWKTCGTSLPGYGSGWFRLYNKSKALIFLSDKKEAVFVPTRNDYCILLSAENNSALLAAIQQRGSVI